MNCLATRAAMICGLPCDHPGDWHYDEMDDITWREGDHTPALNVVPARAGDGGWISGGCRNE